MKVFNIGSLNVDFVYSLVDFVKPGETVSAYSLGKFPGGKGLNQSVALARAGAEVIHGGMIGGDGKFLSDLLSDAGVDVSHIKTVDTPTGHAVIQVADSGQNCIIIYGGANRCFDTDYVKEVLSSALPGDILLLQNEINLLGDVIRCAKEKGMTVYLNPSPMSGEVRELPAGYVDMWMVNETEGEGITGETTPDGILRGMAERFPDAEILLTVGENGSYYRRGDISLFQPAFACKAVDTTAAGDTYTGYFTAMKLCGRTTADAMKIASAASAMTVSKKGAASSIPTLSELKKLYPDLF